MIRLLQYIPPLAGAGYAIAGVAIGFSGWRGDWLQLLSAGAAFLAGFWATAASLWVESPAQRRPLLAISFLAPITLIPPPFQPLEELTALRLLVVATTLDAFWVMSWVKGKEAQKKHLNRWPWLALTYGGALALAMMRLPLVPAPLVWGFACLIVLVVACRQRLLHPADLNQEAAAHHTLWTLLATVVVVVATSWLAPGEINILLAA